MREFRNVAYLPGKIILNLNFTSIYYRYNSHLFDKGISVVLITNDRENQKIAKEKNNLDSCSIHAYVKVENVFPHVV